MPIGAFFLFGPDPSSECVPVIEDAVFHDVTDLAAVVDVVQGVLVENDEVGDLADLDGAEVFLDAEGFGADDGGGPEGFHISKAAHLEGPDFVVSADTFVIAVAAEADAAAGAKDAGVDMGGCEEAGVDGVLRMGVENGFDGFGTVVSWIYLAVAKGKAL